MAITSKLHQWLPNPTHRRLFYGTLLTLACACLIYFGYWLALRLTIPNHQQLQQQAQQLATDNSSLERQRQQQETRATLLQQEVRVVRQANNQLLADEQQRQDEIANLRSELSFYQRLAGSGAARQGLTVHSLEIEPTNSSQVVRFVLTLTQNLQKANVVRGELRVKMQGFEDNQPVLLDWSVLSPESPAPLSFEFKYFQQLDGFLTLPDNFQPETITVALSVPRQTPVQVDVPWSEAFVEDS